MSSTRIPRGINFFNSYIVNTNTYLLTGTPNNATRLGLLASEQTQWTGFVTQWTPLYAKYTDKKSSRTTVIKDQLLNIIASCVRFDQQVHLLDRIAASPVVTIADLEMFNIKSGILQKNTRGAYTSSITEPVIPTIIPLGGGSVQVKCYSNQGVRAGIFPEADAVQYTYTVSDKAPESVDATELNKEISTRGSFSINLGGGASGKTLFIYFRWYCISNPSLSGPWTGLQNTLVL